MYTRIWPSWSAGTSAAISRLRAKRDAESEESGVRRTDLCPNDSGCFSHLFPDPNCHGIHVQQSYLLAAFPPETVDADFRQKTPLPRLKQVRLHTDCRRIFDVLHVLRILFNDLIVQRCRGVFRDKAFQKVIRRGTGVMLWNVYSATRRENQ